MLVALKTRWTTRLFFSQLASVLVGLCALAFIPIPQLSLQTCADSAEGRFPCREDGGSSSKELVVSSTICRRANGRHRNNFSWPRSTGNQPFQIASQAPTVVGHQLANGLRAPLLT